MAQTEYAHGVRDWQIPVEGQVPGGAKGNHQFANLALPHSPDERVTSEDVNGGLNCLHCIERCLRLLAGKKAEQPLEVAQGDRRINYPRQGLGRGAFFPRASRSSHACTSSAR
jgi:hypothetical protein